MNTTLETQGNDPLKQRHEGTRKRIPSKLDEFAPELLQMAREMKTIPEMLDWLKERDVTTSASNLSHFLKRQRMEAERNELRERLSDEQDLGETVAEWFAAQAGPKLETIIGVFKMLVLNLATKKELDPQLLKLADRLTRTALGHVNDQSRADYRERKLVMEEAKHAERMKDERMRGWELCLDETKKYPGVAELYRAAFAAHEAAVEGVGQAPSANSQAPEKQQAPSADERPAAPEIEDEDEHEDEEESGRRVKAKRSEPRRRKGCGRRTGGKASRAKRQASAFAKATARQARENSSTKDQEGYSWTPTLEKIEDEHEDEHEEEKSGDGSGGEAVVPEGQPEEVDPVKLVQAEIEKVRWAKRHDCKY
jgi:hypothetical protein